MVILAPFAKKLPGGKSNPKDYPHWPELISILDYEFVQVGVDGETQLVPDFRRNLKIPELKSLIVSCDFWISVDSFFQHLAYDLNKPGFVIWGPSDPRIFGYEINTNLIKDRSRLSNTQFYTWDQQSFDPRDFLAPEEIKNCITDSLPQKDK